jgi:hypothetical protein
MSRNNVATMHLGVWSCSCLGANVYCFELDFVVNKRDQFLINSEIHSIDTRHGSNFHLPLANLDIYQKAVHYSGIKISNSLPSRTKKNFLIILRHLKWF